MGCIISLSQTTNYNVMHIKTDSSKNQMQLNFLFYLFYQIETKAEVKLFRFVLRCLIETESK